MKNTIKLSIITLAILSAIGCTRIETGEVGVRVDMSKQIQGTELMAGTWNQTVFGEVLTFPVKDITISIENKTPLTADNSALADFDLTAVYSINPSSVAELYSTKAKSFHALADKGGDIFLMFNYMATLLNNASYKVVRNYKSLELADNRAKIEAEILQIVNEQLKSENLGTSLQVTVVQVRNILPNAQILAAATEYVRSTNELRIKENEVKLAEAEARRMSALANQSSQSIQYMQAQALLNISEGIKNGKVQTIVVPQDFKGMVNVGK